MQGRNKDIPVDDSEEEEDIAKALEREETVEDFLTDEDELEDEEEEEEDGHVVIRVEEEGGADLVVGTRPRQCGRRIREIRRDSLLQISFSFGGDNRFYSRRRRRERARRPIAGVYWGRGRSW